MTVYVVHEVRDPIQPAQKFGDLLYVNRYYIHGDELEPSSRDWTIPHRYLVNMERVVLEFRPDADFLLIAGDHLQLLALAGMLGARFNSFMVLRWDRKISDYIPVRLHSGLRDPSPHANLPPRDRDHDHKRDVHIGEPDGQNSNEVTTETIDQYRARTGSAKGFYGF